MLAAGLNESRQGGCAPCRPHTLVRRLEATPLLPSLSDHPPSLSVEPPPQPQLLVHSPLCSRLFNKKASPHDDERSSDTTTVQPPPLFTDSLRGTSVPLSVPPPPEFSPTLNVPDAGARWAGPPSPSRPIGTADSPPVRQRHSGGRSHRPTRGLARPFCRQPLHDPRRCFLTCRHSAGNRSAVPPRLHSSPKRSCSCGPLVVVE